MGSEEAEIGATGRPTTFNVRDCCRQHYRWNCSPKQVARPDHKGTGSVLPGTQRYKVSDSPINYCVIFNI